MSEAIISIPQIENVSNIKTKYGTFSINCRPTFNPSYQYNVNQTIIYITLVYNYSNPVESFAMSAIQGQTFTFNHSWAAGSGGGYNAYLSVSINGSYINFTATGEASMPAFSTSIMYAAIVE